MRDKREERVECSRVEMWRACRDGEYGPWVAGQAPEEPRQLFPEIRHESAMFINQSELRELVGAVDDALTNLEYAGESGYIEQLEESMDALRSLLEGD